MLDISLTKRVISASEDSSNVICAYVFVPSTAFARFCEASSFLLVSRSNAEISTAPCISQASLASVVFPLPTGPLNNKGSEPHHFLSLDTASSWSQTSSKHEGACWSGKSGVECVSSTLFTDLGSKPSSLAAENMCVQVNCKLGLTYRRTHFHFRIV